MEIGSKVVTLERHLALGFGEETEKGDKRDLLCVLKGSNYYPSSFFLLSKNLPLKIFFQFIRQTRADTLNTFTVQNALFLAHSYL